LTNEFEPSINSHKDTYVKSSLVFSLGNAWIQLVYFSLMIAAMLYLVVSDGSPAVLGPFLVVALFMRGYITNILNTIPIWSRAGVALERLYDEGFQDVQIGSPLVAPKSSLHTQGEPLSIEVDGVSYQYDGVSKGSSFSVGPLNLTLNSGELVFVVGHNGAGKTTFAKVLSGLYSNGSGVIRCNGKPIEDSNRDSYRELFSVLFTDPYIFDTLFFEDGPNYANRVESNEIISHYLEKIQLNQKVSFNNDRLDSVDLSHGQRKRLALLAAYLENKPILIFDEWAENQDPEFKAVFYQELLPELTRMGKLVIVISHEAQYYSVADRIIELKANVEKSSIVTDRVLG